MLELLPLCRNARLPAGVGRPWVMALLMLAGLGSGCTRQGAGEWKTTTVDDRFSFQMPGEPKIIEKTGDSPLGELHWHEYQLVVGKPARAYTFAATDLPDVIDEPKGPEIEERLEGAQQGAVANLNGKLLRSQQIQIAGYPGRDCLIQVGKAGFARMHFALKGRTLVIMEADNINSKEADRFFDSLKLLEDAPANQPAKPPDAP